MLDIHSTKVKETVAIFAWGSQVFTTISSKEKDMAKRKKRQERDVEKGHTATIGLEVASPRRLAREWQAIPNPGCG